MKVSLLQKYVSIIKNVKSIMHVIYCILNNLLIKMQFSIDQSCDFKFTAGASMDDFQILFDARKPKANPLTKSHSHFGCCNDIFLAILANAGYMGVGLKFNETIFQHHWACENLCHCFLDVFF